MGSHTKKVDFDIIAWLYEYISLLPFPKGTFQILRHNEVDAHAIS